MFPRHLAPDPTRRLARGLVAGLVAGLLIGAGAPAPRAAAADADDVEASLNAALEAYRAGDIALAREETAFAATLLDQLKADDLGAFLPEPLPGWTHLARRADVAQCPISLSRHHDLPRLLENWYSKGTKNGLIIQ